MVFGSDWTQIGPKFNFRVGLDFRESCPEIPFVIEPYFEHTNCVRATWRSRDL